MGEAVKPSIQKPSRMTMFEMAAFIYGSGVLIMIAGLCYDVVKLHKKKKKQ